jgi:hypothetical protein
MQAERDHLVRFVFPRLREDLLPRRIHLVDVDLRWGVTSDQDAFELCMDEIDRCKPRFVCMLGGRYGWVPRAQAGRPGGERSITASEIHYAALDRLEVPAFRYFYFRDPAVTRSIPDPHAADYREADGSPAAEALETIKTRIRTARGATFTSPGATADAPLPLFVYPCVWDDATSRITRLEQFGERVRADLMASIDAEFGTTRPPALDEFAEENAAMDVFIEGRVERYVVGSREPIFRALREHAHGRDGTGILCLVGEPGSGKSALLGWFYREYVETAERSGAQGGRLVIPHFVGASARSTNVRQLLRRLCHELAAAAGIPDEIPDDYEKLREAFPAFLEKAAATKHVVILIDAVNQLDVALQAHAMRWLPETLPSGARVILTTLAGPALDALRARRQPPAEVALRALNESDRSAIMDGYLARYRKSLDSVQRSALLGKTDAGVPLYLLTALEELRTLGTHEEITERIRALPDRVQPLFTWILERLERDRGFRDEAGHLIGPGLVRPYCSYIAVGRSGMAQAELAELVSPGDPGRNIPADALGNAAALQCLLRPYLMQRGELLDFFHGQLREAVQTRYLADPEAARRTHQVVADFFHRKADPAGDATWAANHARALGELPYHQTRAELWKEMYDTLTDFVFLEAKCTHVAVATSGARTIYGGVYELLEDYRRALEHFPAE